MRHTYKITLSYKGTNYSGWQNQTTNPKTVQNVTETILKKIAHFQTIQVIGASRTDSGVHACGQVLKVVLPKDISPEKLKMGMNCKLPWDIRVIDCQVAPATFNANRDSISKEYHYYFTHNTSLGAQLSETIYSNPHSLDIELMKKACLLLEGTHDFTHYSTCGGRKVNPKRRVIACSIEKTSFLPMEERIFYFKIQASGYLKYMVRYLMNALFEIGLRKLSLDEFQSSLKGEPAFLKKKKAPPHGLLLFKINYQSSTEESQK